MTQPLESRKIALPYVADQIHVGDMNGDGSLDLVVTASVGHIMFAIAEP